MLKYIKSKILTAKPLTAAAPPCYNQRKTAQTGQGGQAMTATNKQTGATKKRSKAQIKADERYTEKNRENNRENQKKNYKNISATIKREKAEDIAATFKAYGVTVAEVVTATAHRLKDGTDTPEAIRNAAKASQPIAPTPQHQPADNNPKQ